MKIRAPRKATTDNAPARLMHRQDTFYSGPTLFIKGELSDYIQPIHREAISGLFPNAEARIMQGVGHWPHAEKPKAFNTLITRFLAKD